MLSSAEHMPALPPIHDAVVDAAEARGTPLDQDRLLQLTEERERIEKYRHISDQFPNVPLFRSNGVEIGRALPSDRFKTSAAQLDFMPVIDTEGDLISGETSAHPGHTTRITFMLIHGLQNYVLLTDAGVIQRPDVLFGNANPQMAIVMERFGMLSDIARRNPGDPHTAHKDMRARSQMIVSGSFEEVSEAVFSAENKRLEKLLARRLAAGELAGKTILSSTS